MKRFYMKNLQHFSHGENCDIKIMLTPLCVKEN